MTDGMDWTAEGREIGVTLDACHVVVVVGTDPVATAEVALGIGRVQSEQRRVTIGDLLNDAPPLVAFMPGDDAHGLSDSFAFGVSLPRISYPVTGASRLFVVPSGAGPLDYEELLPHPRWQALVARQREEGSLLILAAPANAPMLEQLVELTDGAIIVGDTAPQELSIAKAIAWVRPKRRSTASPLATPPRSTPTVLLPAQSRPHGVGPVPSKEPKVAAAVAGLCLTAALVAGGLWIARRPFSSTEAERTRSIFNRSAMDARNGVYKDRASGVQKGIASSTVPDSLLRRDSLVRDSLTRSLAAPAPPDSFPVLAVANPGDSAIAAKHALRLEQTLTKSGAILELRARFDSVPAGTYGLDLRTRFFLIVGGAYPTREGADSLLGRLRARKIVAPNAGSAVTLPFAFLVQSDVPAKDVRARLAKFMARGQPVYALRQANGSAHLYFGAFDSPQQAALAVPLVREAGVTPTLVYRIGRVF